LISVIRYFIKFDSFYKIICIVQHLHSHVQGTRL